MKQFVALARVSSREQEREGFSLDVQENALKGYAEKQGGTTAREAVPAFSQLHVEDRPDV